MKYSIYMIASLAIFSILLSATACKKENDASAYTPPDGSYRLVFEKIFKPSCGLSSCHSKEGDFGHHSLVSDSTYAHLLNDHAHNEQAEALGLHLVKPGSPDQSFLYAKIKWDGSPYQFGQKMPTGGLKLTANQIEFVRQWIMAGAPESGHVADQQLLQ